MKKRYQYEEKYYKQGYRYIIGLDEAGRGPMAGELVVAGVIFPPDFYDERIYDSKQLSYKKREQLYDIIIKHALAYHIEIISVEDVDRLNVYRASQQGMERCIEACYKEKLFALTDAMPIHNCKHEAIIKGDDLSFSIGAASILAKVTRDRLMEEYAKIYPQYGFEKHKGYCTKLHKERIQEFGICPIHRKSFAPVRKELEKQLSFDI